MKEIPLSRGYVALVDDEDFERIAAVTWHVQTPTKNPNRHYALRSLAASVGPRTLRMHRVVLGVTDRRVIVDHINGDGLDNRRSNLRIATHSLNSQNRQLGRSNTSGFKGVVLVAKTGLFEARIKLEGKSTYLGHFSSATDAAAAYDEAARSLFGSFARLNFPKSGERSV